jgi:hypothetical protein
MSADVEAAVPDPALDADDYPEELNGAGGSDDDADLFGDDDDEEANDASK